LPGRDGDAERNAMPQNDVEPTRLDSPPQTPPTGTPAPFSQPERRLGDQPRRRVILLAEDDRGDQLPTQEALQESRLRGIPIVVLSTSDYPEDVADCYHIGVNSDVHKPMDDTVFVLTIGAIERYWLQVAEPAPR
jgi:hypothetical protein